MMRWIARVLLSLGLTAAVLASCAAPPRGPLPSPTEQSKLLSVDQVRQIVEDRAAQGPRGMMFDGTCEGVNNGGPWNCQHPFPRIGLTVGGYDPNNSNNDYLKHLARAYFGLLTTDWPTYGNYVPTPPQSDPFGYIDGLQQAAGLPAHTFKRIGVLHAYQFKAATGNNFCARPTVFPNGCTIYTAVATADGHTVAGDGWYAKGSGGTILEPTPNPNGDRWVNWSDLDPDNPQSYAAWLGNYVADEILPATCGGDRCWDGYYWEGLGLPTGRSNFVHVDADENGEEDLNQGTWDKCDINAFQIDAYNEMFDILASSGITVAGGEGVASGYAGALEPNDYIGHATAGFNGDFPASIWYDCAAAPHSYSSSPCVPNPDGSCGGNKWDYNMRLAIGQEDANNLNVLMNGEDLWADSYFSAYIAADDDQRENHQKRLVVGSSLLLNAYAVPNRDQVPYWYVCDECLVDPATGAAGTNIVNLGWLGWPYYDAVNLSNGKTLRQTIDDGVALSGLVWIREFEHGMVIVNATEGTERVEVGSGWRYINGSAAYGGDHSHNPGGTVSSVTIDAYDAYVLVRDTAPTPTPGPTYTPGPATATPAPTRTPTRTPTATPTPTTTATASPVATSTPTATPLPCVTMAATIDGNLAEWSGRPSQVVSAGNASYLRPETTPSAADLSARFWTACSGSDLLFAGVITDTQIVAPSGSIFEGDAAEIAVDALGDGIVRPRQDDHDIFVDPSGRAQDYGYPLEATVVARATPGSNWRFEMRVPLAAIWATLANGNTINVIYGIYDNDAGATQVMIGPRTRVEATVD